MRIIFGLGSLGPGGMERQFVEQMRFFNRKEFDITLFTLFEHPGAPDLYAELPSDLPVYRLDFRGSLDIVRWYRLYKLLKKLQPDIVVSSLFFANTAFRMLQPFVGYHAIAREHNTYVEKTAVQKMTDRFLARFSATIVTVSTTVATFTAQQENIPRERFTVIHNGIDSERVMNSLASLPSRETIRNTMGLSPTDKVLLNVARLIPQKNHRLLIEGFHDFYIKHPDYRLLIVGDGSGRQALELLVRDTGLNHVIQFFGHRDDVWKFYKIADALISTSHIEGLSNTYLEALAVGLPIIATRTAGTDELIREGENGYYIEGGNPSNVVDALEKLPLKDLSAMRASAQSTARAFDIRETVRLYESLFHRITT